MKRQITKLVTLAALGFALSMQVTPAEAQKSKKSILVLDIKPGSSVLGLNLGLVNINSKGKSKADGTQTAKTDAEINLGPILTSKSTAKFKGQTQSSLLSGLLGGLF